MPSIVTNPTALAIAGRDGPTAKLYPRFTKLGEMLGVDGVTPLGKPPGWVDYSHDIGRLDGPWIGGIVDTHYYGRKDLSHRYFRMPSSDHMPSPGLGAIYLCGSNDLLRWEWLNNGDPILTAADLPAANPFPQLEAVVQILYLPAIDKFVCYPHGADAPTDQQKTVRFVSDNMINWTAEGRSGDLTNATVISNIGQHHGYARMFWDAGLLYADHYLLGTEGFIQGRSVAVDAAASVWRPLNDFRFVCTGQPSLGDVSTQNHRLLIWSTFELQGQPWGVCSVHKDLLSQAHTRDSTIYLAPLADDWFTIIGKPREILAKGAAGEFDDHGLINPITHMTRTHIYIWYGGFRDDPWPMRQGVARCRMAPDGTYDHLASEGA